MLSAAFSRDLIDEVIDVTGKREKRSRLLPAHVVVGYVIGLGLFSGQAQEEVMRQLTSFDVPSTRVAVGVRDARPGRCRDGIVPHG